MTPTGTTQPTGTIATTESLILFGLQIFIQLFSLFKHPTTPFPTSAAPAVIKTLSATPGVTDAHKQVISDNVKAAAEAADKS